MQAYSYSAHCEGIVTDRTRRMPRQEVVPINKVMRIARPHRITSNYAPRRNGARDADAAGDPNWHLKTQFDRWGTATKASGAEFQ